MPDANETIARLFFESLGFLVSTNVKYHVRKHGVPGTSDLDLVVLNQRRETVRDLPFLLGAEQVRGLAAAMVEVKGWHTTRFSPAVVKDSRSGLGFLGDEAWTEAKKLLRTDEIARVLVVSRQGATADGRKEAASLLQQWGVDHIIEFHTLLGHLLSEVGSKGDYSDTETLHAFHLLKNYEKELGIRLPK